jgi:molybdopterin-binding protein
VVDGGKVLQRAEASELAAAPASAFVADFTGATTLSGLATPGADGLTCVRLDGGGEVYCTGGQQGRVAVTVFPWEIALASSEGPNWGSARNRLAATVTSVTSVGNRVRVGLHACQPLVAEITEPALRQLALHTGDRVVASWKATATRIVEL